MFLFPRVSTGKSYWPKYSPLTQIKYKRREKMSSWKSERRSPLIKSQKQNELVKVHTHFSLAMSWSLHSTHRGIGGFLFDALSWSICVVEGFALEETKKSRVIEGKCERGFIVVGGGGGAIFYLFYLLFIISLKVIHLFNNK